MKSRHFVMGLFLSGACMGTLASCDESGGQKRGKKRGNRDQLTDCAFPMVESPDGIAFSTVSSGSYMSCGVTMTGELKCWGSRESPWDADSDVVFDSCPSTEKRYSEVFMGGNYHCALTTEGFAECWHDSLSSIVDEPVAISDVVFSNIAVLTDDFSPGACGLTPDGDVRCWGDGAEFIPSGLPDSAFPIQHIALPDNMISGYACVIQADSSVYCFDDYGPVEDDGNYYPQGFFDGPAKKVVVRDSVVCIQAPTGELECQDNFWIDQDLVNWSRGTWEDFDLGGCGSCPPLVCKLTSGGAIQCDGWLNYGALDVPPGVYSMFDVGHGHICALDEQGMVTCWGTNSAGQCGGPPSDTSQDYD